jgi:hypothetical protein
MDELAFTSEEWRLVGVAVDQMKGIVSTLSGHRSRCQARMWTREWILRIWLKDVSYLVDRLQELAKE